jgi:hypothetical protein
MADTSQSWTQNIDTLYATTWAYRKQQATQQAFLKTPFIFWLREKGRIQNVSGYRRIEIPLEYGDNETVRWIEKGSTVPLTDSELATMAYENWKYVSVTIMRWLQDEQQNRGKAQVINMADIKMGAAERALWEEFERVMFANGTGSLEPNGLQNIVSATPTTGTLHGINRATVGNEYFRNQQKTASGAASLYLVSDMRTCFNDVLKYSKAELTDITIVTDQTVFELYEEEGYEQRQFINNKLFDAGFDTLQFRGRPIMWCPSAPAGNMYFLNVAYLSLICDEGYWMAMTDWKTIPNQPFDRTAQIVCTCNMVSSRPIVNKVLTGIAA